MTDSDTRARNARDIIDATQYLVLATADRTGTPWGSPVYFAHSAHTEFFWVSSPDATHSCNIAVRPQVGIVVFDTSVPIGTGQGVYMPAVAERVGDDDLARGIEVFSRRSLTHGGVAWSVDDVGPAAGMLLYRAVAESHSVLAKDGRPDHRVPTQLT